MALTKFSLYCRSCVNCAASSWRVRVCDARRDVERRQAAAGAHLLEHGQVGFDERVHSGIFARLQKNDVRRTRIEASGAT